MSWIFMVQTYFKDFGYGERQLLELFEGLTTLVSSLLLGSIETECFSDSVLWKTNTCRTIFDEAAPKSKPDKAQF